MNQGHLIEHSNIYNIGLQLFLRENKDSALRKYLDPLILFYFFVLLKCYLKNSTSIYTLYPKENINKKQISDKFILKKRLK